MRILVLGDIHSNWEALRAIDEEFDHCLFTGDLVEYGTDPLPCLDWIRKHRAIAVRGNHDHALAQGVHTKSSTGFRRLAAVTRELHRQQLSRQQLKFLGRLPVTTRFRMHDTLIQLVHATPRDPMDEYLGNDPITWQQRTEHLDADFLCVGHSHIPFHITLENGVQILNPGSVGQPRDGDPRAAYAMIIDGEVSLRRVEYDIDAAIAQVRACNLPNWVAELNAAVWRSGGQLTKEELDRFS